MGPVLGPHANDNRTRETRAAEPLLPAPRDGRPGEGRRLTPDAPHNGGRPPPRGRRLQGPHCGVPTPAPTAPGSHGQGRGTLAARFEGRAARGGTAPDTRRPSQQWTASPPGTDPHYPRGTQPPPGVQAKGTVLGPHTRAPAPSARGWRTATAGSEDGHQDEGERLTSDAPRNGAGHPPGTPSRLTTRATRATGGAPKAATSTQTPGGAQGETLGAGSRSQHSSSQTHAPPHPQHSHQPREIRTPSPAFRHSDTTMAEPAAPRKTRPRSPTLDAAHEVIRALGLRGGDGDPQIQEDADADSDLEMIPGPPAGSAPREPTPPARSVPALCPAWKWGHCIGEDWCPKQHPRPGPDVGALPAVKHAAARAALRYGVAQGWILDETTRGSVNIQEVVDRVAHTLQTEVALHTRGRHGGPAEKIVVEPTERCWS